MSNLQFDEDYQGGYNYSSPSKGMAGWLVDKGLVKDKKSAEMIMVVFAVAGIIFSIYMLRRTYGSPTTQFDGGLDFGAEEMENLQF